MWLQPARLGRLHPAILSGIFVGHFGSAGAIMLTKRQIERAKTGRYSDGNNLYLSVKPSGNKYWMFRFMIRGQAREMSLGRIEDLPIEQARQQALMYKQMVRRGLDPVAEAANNRPTDYNFQQVAEQYINEQAPAWRATDPKKIPQWRNTLATYAYPIIGHIHVSKVTTTDVANVLRPIWTTKNPTATKVRGRIERIMGYAKASGMGVTENPATWVGNLKDILPNIPKRHRTKHFRSLSYTEAPEFLKDIQGRSGKAARCLEWVMMTAVRSSNGYEAVWREIDLERKLWIIPAEQMKADVEHRVPLTDAMIRFLGDPKEPDMPIFPNSKGSMLSDASLLAVVKRAGWYEKTVVHGLRSTFTGWAREVSPYPEAMIRAALAHTEDDTYSAYVQSYDLVEKRREMMSAWADYCNWKV